MNLTDFPFLYYGYTTEVTHQNCYLHFVQYLDGNCFVYFFIFNRNLEKLLDLFK